MIWANNRHESSPNNTMASLVSGPSQIRLKRCNLRRFKSHLFIPANHNSNQSKMSATFLKILKGQEPSLSVELEEISSLHEQKLWHNITSKIEHIITKLPSDKLYAFYQNFLAEFELKLNLFSLANIIVYISERTSDAKLSMALLEDVAKKCEDKQNSQAALILRIETASVYLKMKQFTQSKTILHKAKETLDTLGYNVDNLVFSGYYRCESEYFKSSDLPNDFYKSQLLYLAYTPIEKLSLLDQQRIAYDLGIAALLGDKIYNFGELLGHPVVNSLINSSADWLYKLLVSFNKGDIKSYVYVTKNNNLPNSLSSNAQFLNEKMQLMSLMELVFTRLAGERTITFTEVGRAIESNDVEVVLLRALSLNLIKGVIDEVKQTIYVSWVQPRVLDLSQVEVLKHKIGTWLEKVVSTLSFLEKEGKLSFEEGI
jgi:26S proteasome regulatory subunit N9